MVFMLPILLIHGFPFDGSMWRAQREFLESAAGGGLTVITPDLPGFGASAEPVPREPSMEEYAEAVHRVMHEHGAGRFIVGGMSMGGYVVFPLLRAYPNHVAAVMLIDTRAEADAPDARANRLKAIEDIRAMGNTTKLIHGLLPRLVGVKAGAEVQQNLRAMMASQLPEAVIAAQTAMASRRDQTDYLPAIRVPTLIVVGDQDVITPPAVARGMREKIPGSQLVEIPDCGHMSPVEAPEALNAAIRDFAMTVN